MNDYGLIEKMHDEDLENAILHYLFSGEKVDYILSHVDVETLNKNGKLIYNTALELLQDGEPVDIYEMKLKTGIKGKALSKVLKLPQVTPEVAVSIHNKRTAALKAKGVLVNWNGSEDIFDRFDDWVGKLEHYRALSGVQNDEVKDIKQGLHEVREYLENIHDGKVKLLKPGLPDMDKILTFEPGDIIIIGARPSVGKTAFALELAGSISQFVEVGFISLEMTIKGLVFRLINEVTGFSKSDLVEKRAEVDDVLHQAFLSFKNKNILFSETGLNSRNLSRKIENLVKRGAKAIFIDYFQLIEHSGKTNVEGYSAISRRLKSLAKKFKVPFIILSQLNREPEKRKYGRPVISDLKETGQLEQDADKIILLWRPKEGYFKGFDATLYSGLAESNKLVGAILAKHRDGKIDEFYYKFEGIKFSQVEYV